MAAGRNDLRFLFFRLYFYHYYILFFFEPPLIAADLSALFSSLVRGSKSDLNVATPPTSPLLALRVSVTALHLAATLGEQNAVKPF